jgi:gliding motility-associated-like protein
MGHKNLASAAIPGIFSIIGKYVFSRTNSYNFGTSGTFRFKKTISISAILLLILCLNGTDSLGQKVSKATGLLNVPGTWTDLIPGTGNITISTGNKDGTNSASGAIAINDALFDNLNNFIGIVNAVPTSTSFTLQNGALNVVSGAVFKKQGTSDATIVPGTDDYLVIRNGHTITVSPAFSTGGTILNNGSINATGSLTFNNGSKYIHYRNGGVIPVATWASNSNCNIIGVTSNSPAGSDQNFGNFTWDCPSQTVSGLISGVSGMTVKGNFNLVSTGTGIVTLSNTLTTNGNLTLSSGTLDVSTANYKITLGGNWINLNGGDGFAERGGTVVFNGSAVQSISKPVGMAGEIFFNVTINNTSGVRLVDNNITAINNLSMIDGNISANGRILSLNNPAPGALVHTNGQLYGGFIRRAVNTTSGSYLFPVGTNNYYNSCLIEFNSVAPSGYISVQFLPGDPLSGGLPLTESGVNIYTQYTDGYWSVTSSPGYSSTYDLTLNAEGFTSYSVDQSTRIIKRTDLGNWTLSGTHTLQLPPFCKRTGITGINTPGSITYFGLGKSDCITINTQPSDVNTCISQNVNFSVAAVGIGLAYRWQKNGIDLTDNVPFSNTGTPTMTITNVSTSDIGSYSCMITSTCSGAPVAFTRNASLNFSLPLPSLGYKYFRTLTIDQSMVPGLSDLTNFPLLISGTYPFLRTIINGGQVQNTNGYDIAFTDSKGYKLDHQIEKYDPTTGELIAWVRIPVLYTFQNTDLRIHYGNPQITANPSVYTVFNPDYKGVWHLNDQNSIIDQTGGGSSGTNMGVGGAVNIAGKIGGALDFENGDGDFISIANEPEFDLQEAITLSAWIKVESFSVSGQSILTKGSSAWSLQQDGSNNTVGFYTGPSGILKGVVNVNDGNWHYVVGTYDKQLQNLYIDGALDNSISNTNPISLNNNAVYIGENSAIAGSYFDGIIDETRVLGVARSGSWVKAEYLNQSNPGSFYSIGSESANSIFDNFAACGNTPTVYSVPNTPGHIYTWTVGGGTFPPTTGNSAYVTWGSVGPWNIQLAESSGGCSASSITYNVAVSTPPAPVISGNNDVCPDAAGVVYSTPYVAGNTYNWIFNGGTVPGSYTDNSISIDWNATGPGTLKVIEFNTTTGCSITTPDYVVQIRDVVVPVIIAPAPVTVYTDAGICSASGVSLGSPVTSDNCSVASFINDSPTVFPLGSTTVTWTVTDGVGNSAIATQTVTVNILPAPILTSSDTDNNFCPGTSVTFTATAVGWTNYDFRVDGISVQNGLLTTYTTTTLANGQTVNVIVTNSGGCSATSSGITNSVIALPVVTFPGVLVSPCVSSTTYALSGGIPAGGTYSGPGVTGTNFNASVAGVGTHTITYTFTDITSGCTNTASNNIVVKALPAVTFSGLLESQCITTTTYTLNGGAPAGGTYNGPGVTGTNFNPGAAGLGTHTITYSYTDVTSGCTNTAINSIVVSALPAVTFPGLLTSECINSTSYSLSGGNPAGGTFSGSGVTGTNFDASIAGVGTHTITYSFTDLKGCTNSATNSIVVNSLPVVTFTGLLSQQCISSTTYTLSGGSPAGGTYSGPGVTGTNFNASVAGTGTHTITYSYTNAHGCKNSATNTIVVKALPVVTFTGILANQCVSSTTFTLSGGNPAGGTYSGPGVTGTNFNASAAGIGTHTITYRYTDISSGCSNAATNTIVVQSLPVVTFTGQLAPQCISSDTYTLSGGSPAGGTYSGPGVAGTNFNSSVAGVGTHTVTYRFTDVGGCTNYATNTIVVNALPIVTFSVHLTAQCITSTTYTLNGGTPSGGTYSGPGVVGTNFNASAAGLGQQTLTYTYTDINGCTNSATNTTIVKPLPSVSFPGLLSPQCVNSTTYTLVGGTPAGGIYSGPGVTGTNFNASVAGIGTHTITYSYSSVYGCVNYAVNTIVVRALPIVSFTTELAPQCVTSTVYTLSGGNPAGGTYSGPGVTGTNFNASLAGVGTHTITYSYNDVISGCSNTATNTIFVRTLPAVSFPGQLTTQCILSTTYTLSGGIPAGGTYSGPGVIGTNFNASIAGAGIHTITYNFTDVNGCTNTATNTIVVNTVPEVTFPGPLAPQCISSTTYTLSGGTPSGGTYSGPGVTGSNFSASAAGAGTHTITYRYTDVSGCTNAATNTMVVRTLPVVSFTGVLVPQCVSSLTYTLSGGNPAGGTYSGAGVTGTNFNASIAGAGTHTIIYSYTDINGCINTAANTIIVRALPIVTFPGVLATQCISSTAYTLSGGTPVGGLYSGPGVTGTNFNASVAGLGTQIITYSYADVNGCINTSSNSIVVNALPSPTFSEQPVANICSNTDVTYSTQPGQSNYIWTFQGVSGIDYSIISGGTGTDNFVTLKWLTSGNKTVTINYTSVVGCPAATATSSASTTVINSPTLSNAGPDQTDAPMCGLASTVLAANTPVTGTGSWSIVSGTGGIIVAPDSPVSTFSGTAGITYVLRWTISNALCTSSTDDVNIRFNLALTVTGTHSDVLCNGTSTGAINITASGGTKPYIYSWTGTGVVPSSEDQTGLAAGTYSVIVTDANGCTSSTFSVNLSQPLTTLTGTISVPSNVSCSGSSNGSVIVSGAGGTLPYMYSMNGGTYQASGTFGGLSAATYVVVIRDANLCTTNVTATVSQPQALSITYTKEDVSCPGVKEGRIILNITGGVPPYNAIWSDGVTTLDRQNIADGTYSVVVTDLNGCAASLSVQITFTVSDKCLVIPNIITPNNDGYNDTWVILNIDLFPDAEVFVYDRWGKLVFNTKNILANPWDGTFNGKPLPTDSYHYILYLNDGSKPKTGVISIIR